MAAVNATILRDGHARFLAGEPLDPAIREHVTLLITLEIVSQQGFGKLLREPKEDVAAFSERRKAAAEAARASRSPSSSPRR